MGNSSHEMVSQKNGWTKSQNFQKLCLILNPDLEEGGLGDLRNKFQLFTALPFMLRAMPSKIYPSNLIITYLGPLLQEVCEEINKKIAERKGSSEAH